MTFLELCQAVAIEAGISGSIVSTANQVGEAQRVVRWVARAYKYIQNLHEDWKFLRNDVSFPVAAGGTGIYSATDAGVANFGRWCFLDRWRSYATASGYADEQPIDYVPYDEFRRVYGYGTARQQTGRPTIVTVRPDQSLQFWPIPDNGYTIVGEQFRTPAVMAADSDTPIFEARFHDTITYRALFYYGEFEGDATVLGTSQTELARELEPMESYYLPKMTMGCGGALA